MCRLSAEIGRPVTFALVQYDTSPDDWRRMFDRSAEAATRGARVHPLTVQGTLPDADVLIRGGRIAALGSALGVPPGTTVIEEGAVDDHLFALVHGRLRVHQGEQTLTLLDAGATVIAHQAGRRGDIDNRPSASASHGWQGVLHP